MADYNVKEVEQKVKNFWEKEKIYKFSLKNKGELFSIDIPPPTVSGRMHIGHACSYSQQDFIARFKRMTGNNVLYPFGTDDNGLPTERLIEKIKGIKSKSMKRSDFIKLCLTTLKEITPEFINDWKNIGVSCDYSIYYSTIDDLSRRISQKSFIELYKKGLIYKKMFPSIWCPECQTSIAQAELEDRELPSLFTTLKFICESKDLLIATTRPELLGACVAIFINPGDKRYKNLVGKKAKVPLFDYEVPIITDESAQIDKGTGVLMVCSYGDKYDAEAINKHKLIPKIVLNYDGTLKIGKYSGMKIKEARKRILEDLKEKNLVFEQKQISHAVNVHDKCGTEIEFLPTEQWFIKILDKKNDFLNQGNKIDWHPEFMHKRYDNWINGLEWDWNISRDRHFGVPIPVWECSKCKEIILAGEKELPIDPTEYSKKCPKCKIETKPEEKVFDTWATSSVTPQIISELLDNKIKIPFSMRPHAHEIIRTWTFYTIVKSLYHENKIPWKNLMISGFVTMSGEKMSKSKGNVINPIEVIEKYSSDALRFWAAGSKLGEDLDYQEKDLIAGKKFETKLWNASNFVFMNLKDFNFKKPKKLEKIDELFLIKLNDLIKSCTEAFENYEYFKAKIETEKFFWNMFCDNYLEIVKKRIYSGNEAFPDSQNPKNKEGFRDENKKRNKESAQYTLYHSLLTILKLIAPIMPFITEELYQEYFKKTEKEKSIHISEWPSFEKEKKADEFDLFIDILSKVRQEKSNNKKSMKAEIILSLNKLDIKKLVEMTEDLKDVCCAKEVREGEFNVEFI